MKSNPMISVIVPIYKVEKYLDQCIASIVSQTYPNLEIILVDDGSPDHCPEICDRWAEKDARIKVLHKENGGLSDARNAGLLIARGDYLAFVDSDDYVSPNIYQILLNSIVSSKSDVAICNIEYFDDNNIPIYKESPLKDEILTRNQAFCKLVQKNWWYYVTVWNKLYTRKSFDGITFPKGKLHEDQFIIHQVFSNCDKISCIDKKLYFYRQRSASIMGNSSAVCHLDSVEAVCMRYAYFKKNGMTELAKKTRPILEGEYTGYRWLIDASKLSSSEINRVNQIDKMFKFSYFDSNRDFNLKKEIKYRVPILYFFSARIRYTLQIKEKSKCIKSLLKYAIGIKINLATLLDTPTHGNLGDHAIVLAEQQLLAQCGIKSYELTATQINSREAKYAAVTPMNQYILVHGGGFLGALWPNEEERFRRILQAFKKQKIIVFPQTVTFDTTTPEGRKYLEESQRIYAAHPDLTIFLREKRSYAFMQQYFPTVRCLLVPDIVTLLNVPDTVQPRKGILFCMRRDLEKAIDDAAQQEMLTAVQTQYPDETIEYTDTVIDHDVMPEKREEEVNKKLAQFSGARLIVTDRLHGMVFAALTNTPCIAMSNSNGKVKAVYEWIEGNDYIRFANSVAEFKQQLQTLDVSRPYTYDRKLAEREFAPLLEEIRKLQK